MKFITVRELVSKQKEMRELVSKEQAILTYNGKPIALINPLNEDNFEYVVKEAAAAWAMDSMKKMQAHAKKRGLTQKDVDREIAAYRKEKADKNAKRRP